MSDTPHLEETALDLNRDRIFAEEQQRIADFNFGAETAAVFDDMLDRSVPFYQEIQRMTGELAADFAMEGSAIWDLGCSTANSFLEIAKHLQTDALRFVGLDSSEAMLDRARQKLAAYRFRYPFELRLADINQPLHLEDASVSLLLLTLQFVRPMNRERLLRDIFNGTRANGCLILVEKVVNEDPRMNRLFIEHYYAYKKRNGYSELEIAQKREALENVLIPYRLDENVKMLTGAGFKTVEIFFKWYNFCGIIATK
jgi:tRNA (cmo5U34)-methyltransferase